MQFPCRAADIFAESSFPHLSIWKKEKSGLYLRENFSLKCGQLGRYNITSTSLLLAYFLPGNLLEENSATKCAVAKSYSLWCLKVWHLLQCVSLTVWVFEDLGLRKSYHFMFSPFNILIHWDSCSPWITYDEKNENWKLTEYPQKLKNGGSWFMDNLFFLSSCYF